MAIYHAYIMGSLEEDSSNRILNQANHEKLQKVYCNSRGHRSPIISWQINETSG